MDDAAEPNCPSCRAAWSREFLNEHLTAAFRNGPFKRHREKVLVDRERARLPETQEQAATYKAAIDFLKPIDAQIVEIHKQIDNSPSKKASEEARITYYNSRGNLSYKDWMALPDWHNLYQKMSKTRKAYLKEMKPLQRQIKVLYGNTRDHRYAKNTYGLVRQVPAAEGGTAAVAVEPRRAFIQKCPTNECEGFLNQQWKCDLCDTKFCKDCHEPKAETHACDMELVESIKAIRKEAKPCPKCASQISKIDGCDQMWCTQCKTAFSWNTGRIETHVIHNPHYFQWMRVNGGMPRAPGDMPPNLCGDYALQGRLNELRLIVVDGHSITAGVDNLMRYLRFFLHIRMTEMNSYRHTIQMNERDEWRRQLRVQRMVREITDEQWKTTLQRKEKESLKVRDKLQLLEMYTTAGMDILAQVIPNTPDEAAKQVYAIQEQLNTLYEYTKKTADKMSSVYNCVPPTVTPVGLTGRG